MSPRVAYWTTSFDPETEAVAAEVACLRRAFPASFAWGISGRDGGQISWRRGFSVPPRMHLAFRAATWLAQRAFDINHVYGGLGDWFHLKAVRGRPTLLTMALDDPPCDPRLLGKIDRFAVEWPAARSRLEALGVPSKQVELIFPPVDLARFRPSPPVEGFTALFASSPDRADWLEARGVHLILDAAALCPAICFRLVWRPWGDSLPEVRRRIEAAGLGNVEVVAGRHANMAELYQGAHATLAPFTSADRCKAAPNSLLESLACGRPVVATEKVGLADVVREERVGIVTEPSGAAIAEALRRLRRDFACYAQRCRNLVERRFSQERFLEAYTRLYGELL